MSHKLVHIAHLNNHVCLVPREQLRRTVNGRTFSIPVHLKEVLRSMPTPPATFSYSLVAGKRLSMPILGNDQYGDCYYAAVCHAAQTYTGNAGQEAAFDAASVVSRYKVLSRGDNGLSDRQIMPEWKAGIVGPNGPHKILDEMTVNPRDDASTALAMWAFCGLIYTAALADAWLNHPKPGDTWDASQPDMQNGHAMFLTGKQADGTYELQTWGFDPPINLTPNGLKGSDPELIVAFSLEMFSAQGIAPCGLSYDALAGLWVAAGGHALPPSPFPPAPIPPSPPPPPAPPPPNGSVSLTLTGSLPAGTYTVAHAKQA